MGAIANCCCTHILYSCLYTILDIIISPFSCISSDSYQIEKTVDLWH
jgi:hypothetical protein